MAVRDVKELTVYIKSYRVAMEFFEISKRFPPEERYALRHPKGADLPDLSAIICAKHGQNDNTKPILSASFPIVSGRTGKRTRHSILRATADTSTRRCTDSSHR